MTTPATLHIQYARSGDLAANTDGSLFADRRVAITSTGMHPRPRIYHAGSRIVIIAGHPIAYGQRDDSKVLHLLDQSSSTAEFAKSLNGSFIVALYSPLTGRLEVVNDRFAGFALYCIENGNQITVSTSFRRALLQAREWGRGKWNPVQVWSFLSIRRLLGEETLAKNIRYLRSASILQCTPANPTNQVSYWQPDLSYQASGGRRLVSELAEKLRAAVNQHMSDSARHGLLLSGGLDSRALLAAATQPPVTLTTCLTKNNEFEVAALVSAIAGAPHHFIPRPPALHDKCLDAAADLSGMQVYNEAQFLGYGPWIAPHADVVMIGLGLDIFFGGLYLPKQTVKILGREGLHHRLLPLIDDLPSFYLNTVKYRLRSSDPAIVIRADRQADLREALHSQTEKILERGRSLGGEGYALWEYLHVHNLSRHYSFPMIESVRTFAECRAPGLDNDLFDLALAMRPEHKLDGTPYQEAIALLNPRLMQVRNANTNLPAGWSLRRQTYAKAMSFGMSWVPGMVRRSPAWQDRSWPPPREALKNSQALLARAAMLPTSQSIEELEIFDPNGIRHVIEDHSSGRHDHSVLINLLLTLDSVCRPGSQVH